MSCSSSAINHVSRIVTATPVESVTFIHKDGTEHTYPIYNTHRLMRIEDLAFSFLTTFSMFKIFIYNIKVRGM